MKLKIFCLLLHLCSPRVTTVAPAIDIQVQAEIWTDSPGYEEPTELEPDGHIPIEWIFRYNQEGQLQDPWWWRSGENPGAHPPQLIHWSPR